MIIIPHPSIPKSDSNFKPKSIPPQWKMLGVDPYPEINFEEEIQDESFTENKVNFRNPRPPWIKEAMRKIEKEN